MRIKKIMKYYEDDVYEVTLPNVNDFPIWGLPYRNRVWTKTNGEEFGQMCCVAFYDNKYNVSKQSISYYSDIIPVFVFNKTLPAPAGHHVFVGDIPCVVLDKNRAMSCCPLKEKRKISETKDIDWLSGFKFENTELYDYLNTEYWTLEVAHKNLVDNDFVSEDNIEKENVSEMSKIMEFADAICCDGWGEERLFFDTENYEAIGIYYVDRGDETGYFVRESIPYWVILEALSFEFENEFFEHISNNRNLDDCYDMGTECFTSFYYDWVDRTDYVEFSKANLIDGAMSSYFGDNVLRNIKEWTEKTKGYDASEVFAKRGIH